MFESSVNSEGIETERPSIMIVSRFESSVNSEGIETQLFAITMLTAFESSVNSEGIETNRPPRRTTQCLRAV